ncbi:hypothetical protein WJX79_003282 [Trebouxia sp. C0005]
MEPPKEPHPQWVGVSHSDCNKMLQHALNRDPTVKFMVDKMKEAGCAVHKSFFQVENCDAQAGGGFRPPDGVVLCHNHLLSQKEVNHALTHELLHAYDHCRAANVDWHNCEHHACSEIRAASLSGDCNFKEELLRGNYGIRKQHQVCVRRRAELSLSMNPSCKGLRGKLAVDKVFDACLKDTAPFDRIP